MTKFLSSTRVCILSATIVLTASIIKTDEIIRGTLPDAAIISQVLQNYIKPYIRSFQAAVRDGKSSKRAVESEIEKIIAKKVEELKPKLDDGIAGLPRGHSEEDGDTTIIELLPHSNTKEASKSPQSASKPLKTNIMKYKKLRKKIGAMLKKESVSDKTENLVTKTLDEMITQLIGRKCTWNDEKDGAFRSVLFKTDENEMMKTWAQKWEDLIKRYQLAKSKTDVDKSDYKDMFLFLMELREFFFVINSELNSLNSNFKLKCHLIERDKERPKKFSIVRERKESAGKGNLRDNTATEDGEDPCKFVKICSEELKTFLVDFYINVNESVDIVFKNYVEMYKRDITPETMEEQRTFVALIQDFNGAVGEKVNKVFKVLTQKLDVDTRNGTDANIAVIKTYIESIGRKILKYIEKLSAEKLTKLSPKIRLIVKQDIRSSVGIEVGNLQRYFSDKICRVFTTCNGNSTRRRNFNDNLDFDKNNIYVKLQLRFDDASFARRSLVDLETRLDEEKYDGGYNRYLVSSTKAKFDFRKYENVSVTRTTYPELETSKSVNF